MHAVSRAGDVSAREVVVNGAGPIGCLVVSALKFAGAARVIAADVSPASLKVATAMGADEVRDISRGDELPRDPEIVFEASGATAALGGVLRAAARGGTVVQVGNLPGGPAEAVLGDLVTREITWIGSYRFVDEISTAVQAMAEGLDVAPVMTHSFPIDDALVAMRMAADRSTGSSKVMLHIA
ncbi:zinc-binding dehydrogenase [Luethyella okanaganae]|uniref:Zinc-binding dehydrogenase n=1 Tax=Luethyella okanaganae TaxID=69372 RepID=A0ABW1VAI0_9MICO